MLQEHVSQYAIFSIRSRAREYIHATLLSSPREDEELLGIMDERLANGSRNFKLGRKFLIKTNIDKAESNSVLPQFEKDVKHEQPFMNRATRQGIGETTVKTRG